VSILDHRPDLGADYLALADETLGRLGMGEARERVASLHTAATDGARG
jgi:chromosome partitioning protein